MSAKIAAAAVYALLLTVGSAHAQDAAAPTAGPAEIVEVAPVTEPQPNGVAAPAADATPTPNPTPTVVAAGKIEAPPEGKGQVVFFRQAKFSGAAVSYKVREGEAELGTLSNGKYFIEIVEPGAHMYVVHSETKDILNLEVEPGETYFVEGTLTVGVLVGRPNLTPVDKAVFDKVSAKLKLTHN